MKRAALVLSLLVVAAPALADRKLEEILLVSSAAADLISTEYSISKGATELNPFAGDTTAQRIAVKSAGTVAIVLLSRLMERQGHPKVASVFRFSAAAVNFTAAGWNVSMTVDW